MKILMLPCDYLPHSVGGREVYTHGLATRLLARGFDVRIAFHVCYGRPEPGFYPYENVPVHALPPLPVPTRERVYSCRNEAVPGYRELLNEFKPDIVHMHDFSYGVSLTHLELAKRAGARTVMTYHSPGQSCLQRSLLYKGRTPCDGRIDLQRCTACRLECSGAPPPLAYLMSALDFSFLAPLAFGPARRLVTAKRMTSAFQDAWDSLCQLVDRIHVHANWARELLLLNKAPSEMIRMFRTGMALQDNGRLPNQSPWQRPRDTISLRVIYWGRIDPVKGVHTLVEAVLQLPPDIKVEVLIVGGGFHDQESHKRELQEGAKGDRRFTFVGRISPEQVLSLARTADICVVPSIWLETGPLTVLEAWAAGLPVIGSRLGGIAELVRDGIDGMLFPPGDVTALSRILHDLALDRSKLELLRRQVPKPRTMDDVCADMIKLYRELVG